ncbi:MAG: hypothetical protein DWB99_05820 [Candidatus Poseidoniales archaeon]|nr:MAG: hypothetical protein DWB99_05820 [Candidatus Poseidoniales archaeon]
MVVSSALCNRWLSSGVLMVGGKDWEDDLIEQMVEMFKGMGMTLSKEQVKKLMSQFRSQFENMGLDAEKIAKGDVNFNFDLSNLSKLFQSGQSMEDILSNLGVDLQVDATPVEIKTPEIKSQDEDVLKLPVDDIYLDGWNMSVTIDFTLKEEIHEDEVELSLISDGSLLKIMKSTGVKPVARVELPHPCEDVVDWSLTNGILDVTLKLTPQGSALDDEVPENVDVSIDFGDDDEDDDGGIPIF